LLVEKRFIQQIADQIGEYIFSPFSPLSCRRHAQLSDIIHSMHAMHNAPEKSNDQKCIHPLVIEKMGDALGNFHSDPPLIEVNQIFDLGR